MKNQAFLSWTPKDSVQLFSIFRAALHYNRYFLPIIVCASTCFYVAHHTSPQVFILNGSYQMVYRPTSYVSRLYRVFGMVPARITLRTSHYWDIYIFNTFQIADTDAWIHGFMELLHGLHRMQGDTYVCRKPMPHGTIKAQVTEPISPTYISTEGVYTYESHSYQRDGRTRGHASGRN